MIQHRALARAALRLCVRAGSTSSAALNWIQRPACGVAVVVLRQDDKHATQVHITIRYTDGGHLMPQVLMVRRGKDPDKGRLSLPGGSVHLGETCVECARREILEETGLRLSMAPGAHAGLRSVLAMPQV